MKMAMTQQEKIGSKSILISQRTVSNLLTMSNIEVDATKSIKCLTQHACVNLFNIF